MKVRIYKNGLGKTLLDTFDPKGGLVELIASDGRTVQLYFNDEGDIRLRAWGNIPASVGNGSFTMFTCNLQSEEPTTCVTCYGRLGKCDCDIQTPGDMERQAHTEKGI